MKITFLFPGKPHNPVGGYKVAFEYANRFANDGYEVSLLYPIQIIRPERFFRRIYNVLRYFRFKGRFSSNIWFSIDPKISETVLFNFSSLPESDIYVCTSVETAIALQKSKVRQNCLKLYFIQGFENWNVSEEQLLASYRYPFVKIVINPFLERIVKQQGCDCYYIPNGFNRNEYSLSIPVEQKEAATVSILYHIHDTKDFKTGLRAISMAKERCPELKALLFGAYEKPAGLPEWCEFYHNPDLETHNEINNRAAIYVGPSRMEGFCLTIGEAMMCGQAVVCTDNPGYTVLAKNNRNALVSKIGDADALAQNIIKLIEDQELRIKIASNGYKFIQDYTVDRAYMLFKEAVESELAKRPGDTVNSQ